MEKKPSSGFWQVVGLAWELGYIIAIPIVVLGLGGAWLDKKISTSPLFLLLGIFLSLLVSGIGIFKKIKSIN